MSTSEKTPTKPRVASKTPGGRAQYEMRIAGEAPYRERMKAYLAGDHSQIVSPQFAAAVAALGRQRVDLSVLTGKEKKALWGRDLRWQSGPDGVLLWTDAVSLTVGELATELRPDFDWLYAAACKTYAGLYTRQVPPWMEAWARSWAAWGHRYASIVYDQAMRGFKAKGNNGIQGSSSVLTKLIPYLKLFVLEYLPVSGIHDRMVQVTGAADDGRWLLPEELLDQRFQGPRLDDFKDDFWNRCCADLHNLSPGGRKSNPAGRIRSHELQAFLDFVAEALNQEGATSRYCCPFLPRTKQGALLIRSIDTVAANGTSGNQYEAPLSRNGDKSCSWISREFPHLAGWEPYAREWIQNRKASVTAALEGLSLFIGAYLANAGKPGTAGATLAPECARRPICNEQGGEALLLRLYHDRVPKTLDEISDAKDKSRLKAIIDFIEHILATHCTFNDEGNTTRLPEYWNPFADLDLDSDKSTSNETVRSAMPYRWICKLRNILAQGAHFSEWEWAQRAQQSELGNSADWFEVDESVIDRDDPDCVWRQRTTGSKHRERTFYEIWSPVRWVALLAKLNTALRTMQVRVLDSGESDAWRFELRQWAAAESPDAARAQSDQDGSAEPVKAPPGAAGTPWVVNDLEARNADLYANSRQQEAVRKKGGKRDPGGWRNGVLRLVHDRNRENGMPCVYTSMYVNTNKTADRAKEGAAKGFDVPMPMQRCPLPPEQAYWVRQGVQQPAKQRAFLSVQERLGWLDELGENTHWWLAKLRDWQEKYNPIAARTEWSELSGTGLINEKSDEQYSMYLPACFLFREPASTSRPNLPIGDKIVSNAWRCLLEELQNRLNAALEPGQQPVRLVAETGSGVEFDLHSIRVSVITALIIDGKVRPEFVQRLVGHSRLVMTIYYTKVDGLGMRHAIAEGFKRAREEEIEKEKRFLANASREEILAACAVNDAESAMLALGIDTGAGQRRVMMWERRLGGICPVGGVAANTEGGSTSGCFNGGPLISGTKGEKSAKHAPVEGGPGTCVNCRWFISSLAHVGELQAIMDASQYRKHEWHERLAEQHQVIDGIHDKFRRKEVASGLDRAEMVQYEKEIDAAEQIRDVYANNMAIELLTQGNAIHLVQRIAEIENKQSEGSENALVSNSGHGELTMVLAETTSEMLHAARISMHAELHPELHMPSATLRASMVLARKMQREGIDPFVLLSLPETLQMKATNALMRHISDLFDPQNLEIGLSKAAGLVESSRMLSEVTGLSTTRLKDWLDGCSRGDTALPQLGEAQILQLGAQEVDQ